MFAKGGASAAAATFDPTSTAWSYDYFEDFLFRSQPSSQGQSGLFFTSSTGTWGKVDTTTTLDARMGIWVAGTSATATASATFINAEDSILFGSIYHEMAMGLQLQAVATSGENYTCKIGYINTWPGTVANGVYFTQDRALSTTNWVAVCVKASSVTSQDTGVALDTNWQNLRIQVDNAAGAAKFSIGGTLTNTISTNIPTAAGQFCGMGFTCQKVSGSSSQSIYIDWVRQRYQLSAARGTY